MGFWPRNFLKPAAATPVRRCGAATEVRQRFRQWYGQDLGGVLADEESRQVAEELSTLFGYHLLQIGCLTPMLALESSSIRHKIVMDLDAGSERFGAGVFAEPARLPVASDSLDVVILPHTLEMDEDPHQVLREVERALVAEGHVIVLCFNPWSLWGVRRLLNRNKKATPWCARFISPTRMKDWLELLGFEISTVRTFFHRPPVRQVNVLNRLVFLDKYGQKLWPAFGAVTLFVARKRVSTLTPIVPGWRRRAGVLAPGLVETRQ